MELIFSCVVIEKQITKLMTDSSDRIIREDEFTMIAYYCDSYVQIWAPWARVGRETFSIINK